MTELHAFINHSRSRLVMDMRQKLTEAFSENGYIEI